ncbi:hypothetical protein Acr_16g0004210 [Actinidia rufa]|uniref:Uncharacterized protein n=1 Tax=Actinidia rufa TaxID=165716 RepID=A0A7J0FZA6_9ERIC|nr:hypothetical protein Acr_16g0004210 [Actinidia rufa]
MGVSSAPPFDSNPTACGASKYLAGLPSRGLFSSTVIASNPHKESEFGVFGVLSKQCCRIETAD